jgi:transposase
MNMASKNQRIEVITSVERRRRWSPHEKRLIVEETRQSGMSVSFVARKYGIPPSQLFYWRKLMEAGGLIGVGSEEEVVPKSKVKVLENRVKELERVLGRKTMENEILREAVKLTREKKLISRQPLPGVEGLE